MLQIAICDDEDIILEYITRLTNEIIKSENLSCNIHSYSSGEQLIEENVLFDVILLDIGMNHLNGIEVAKKIRESSDAVIIFITALKEYVFDAFDVGAFHFLIKPIEKNKFFEVFVKAVKQRGDSRTGEAFLIKAGSTFQKIEPTKVYYAENHGRKIVLHMKDKQVETYGKMDEYELRLGENFYRCHRGYLVNLSEIYSYDRMNIVLKNGDHIYLSKQRYSDFVGTYMRYLKDGD
ncbi:LytR/AlgR family response regulator transcription factor [Anaeromicropila herbilytica]|uniref:Stage 0 sporulation protein A homolog n=1 Tax=Anaeromicropila herbilytica TaxID=2785025 RepID=A0A7R7ICW8_9FIRM|nr:LytTR family DNA-binding domain-containing protein [Anaeromicropila herbilytica]BCN29423.1 DNA-binding response regulator [Anaeromicropila herbilytica]